MRRWEEAWRVLIPQSYRYQRSQSLPVGLLNGSSSAVNGAWGRGASDDLRQTSLPIQGAACARRQAHGYKAVPRLYVLRTGNCASGRRVVWASGQMSVKEMKEG
jgi:hypothetical protein